MKEQELANKIIEKVDVIKNESSELLDEVYGMISSSNDSDWIEKYNSISDEFEDILSSIESIKYFLEK